MWSSSAQSHGRVGGPGVGTGGWGQPRACTGDTSAGRLCMVNIPFPSSSCRLGFGEDVAWPPETVTVTQMPVGISVGISEMLLGIESEFQAHGVAG